VAGGASRQREAASAGERAAGRRRVRRGAADRPDLGASPRKLS